MSVYLVWQFAMRLRRVQVQVVLDKLEATAFIFNKLLFAQAYQIAFMAALFLFQISILIKIREDNKFFIENYSDIEFWKTYEPGENATWLAMAVDVLVIAFFTGLVLNFGILLLALIRLIKFLTKSLVKRVVSYLLLVPFSALYINQCLQIMANLWGAPAYLLSIKLYRVDEIKYDEYFQRSEAAVWIFTWSRNLKLITPLLISILLFGSLIALSYSTVQKKDSNLRLLRKKNIGRK